MAAAKICEELRPRILAGAEKDRVRMGRGFVRQGGHVKPTQRDVRATPPVVIGQAIGAAAPT